MSLMQNMMMLFLIFWNSILFSQIKITNKKNESSTLLQNSWNAIRKEHEARLGIRSSAAARSGDARIDSSSLSVFFNSDSSQLIAEAIVCGRTKSSSIKVSQDLAHQGLLNQIFSLRQNLSGLDSTIILKYIQRHKIPLVKKLNYRPRVYARANYKVALDLTGTNGIFAFLNEQAKIIAQRKKAEKRYTGLIIDARSFYISQTPLINIKCGNFNIFGPEIVNRDKALEKGMVLWASNPQQNLVVARVGDAPLIIVPVKIVNESTFVLDTKFSEMLTANYFRTILKNCAVVILN
ncbi:MAG: hypothetical protein GXO74_00620 [Calditrichaeota bacterium]|nr:hypothetical protein [Calditrichota bacterium]